MIITYEYQGRAFDIEFDAMMHAADVGSSTVTSHPVEKGAPVNDHIRRNADRFNVDAIVSDTPIRPVSTQMGGTTVDRSASTVTYQKIDYVPALLTRVRIASTAKASPTLMQFSQPFSRVRDVYKECQLIQDNGLTVSVRTTDHNGFRDYQNMAILNLGVNTEVGDGSSRTFSFQLQQIRIVETKKVSAPKAKPLAKHKGEKGKSEVKDAEQHSLKSTSAAVLDFATAGLKSLAGVAP